MNVCILWNVDCKATLMKVSILSYSHSLKKTWRENFIFSSSHRILDFFPQPISPTLLQVLWCTKALFVAFQVMITLATSWQTMNFKHNNSESAYHEKIWRCPEDLGSWHLSITLEASVDFGASLFRNWASQLISSFHLFVLYQTFYRC